MKTPELTSEGHQDLCSNLIHLYVLHQACRQPTFGLHIIEELARLGYKLSPGTMYPLLDALEQKGLLRSRVVKRRSVRRIYRATAAGRAAYVIAREQVERLLNALSGTKTKHTGKSVKGSRTK